jgi:hypothetical protein
MKAIHGTLLLLGGVASASASAIEKRQLTGLFGGPVAKPISLKDVKPEVRPDAKRQIVRYGPFNLPGLKNVAFRKLDQCI